MVPLVVSDVATHRDALLYLVAQKNGAPRLRTALLAAHVCEVAALSFCFTVCQPRAFPPGAPST
jgi:hypothetical protein